MTNYRLCPEKPNRSNPRRFTARDVKRIIGYVDDSPVNIIADVAIALGFGALICLAAKVIQNGLALSVLATRIAGALAASAVLNAVIQILSRGVFLKVPLINQAVIILTVLVANSDALKSAVDGLIDTEEIDKVSAFLSELCDVIDLRGKL